MTWEIYCSNPGNTDLVEMGAIAASMPSPQVGQSVDVTASIADPELVSLIRGSSQAATAPVGVHKNMTMKH